jgi:hypothetical protein
MFGAFDWRHRNEVLDQQAGERQVDGGVARGR